MRCAADSPVGIAGNHGEFAAFVLEAGIPALLRKGAAEPLRWHFDFPRDILTLRKHGVETHRESNNLMHRVLSVVPLEGGRSKSEKRPTSAASYFVWAFSKERPNLTNGGARLPYREDGLYPFDPPRAFLSCEAGTWRVAMDGSLSDPTENYYEAACQLG